MLTGSPAEVLPGGMPAAEPAVELSDQVSGGSGEAGLEPLPVLPAVEPHLQIQDTGPMLLDGVWAHIEHYPQISGLDQQPLQMAPLHSPTNSYTSWFLAPEAWITYRPTRSKIRTSLEFEENVLVDFVGDVKAWLKGWVTESHSPLVHGSVHKFKLTRHTMDAYTAVTAYFGRNSKNERMVFRIIEDRVTQLLEDQPEAESADDLGLDAYDHLVRTQALLMYQVIRLFDGDIRMRSMAETQISTLERWCKQMLDKAMVDPTLGFAAHWACDVEGNPLHASWRAWIMAESVRRTWKTAMLIQNIYLVYSQGWAPCTGDIYLTMKNGLWEAPSAPSWLGAAEGGDPLFMRPSQLYTDKSALSRLRPENTDDFSHTILSMYVKPDELEGWRGRRIERPGSL